MGRTHLQLPLHCLLENWRGVYVCVSFYSRATHDREQVLNAWHLWAVAQVCDIMWSIIEGDLKSRRRERAIFYTKLRAPFYMRQIHIWLACS